MSSRPDSPSSSNASDFEPSTNPTSSFPTPARSPKVVHNIPLRLHLGCPVSSHAPAHSSSAFTRDVIATINAHNERWARKPRNSSTSLNAQKEQTVKEPNATVTPRAFPRPTGWEVLPTPTPREKDNFLGDIAYEIKKLHNLRAGLQSYLEMIHSETHTTFPPAFLATQIEQVAARQTDIDAFIPKFERIQAQVMTVTTPTGTPTTTPMNQAQINDYFSLTKDDTISQKIHQEYNELKVEAHKIRKFFMDAHVWYKINYALVAKKDVDVPIKGDVKEEENKK